MKKLFTILALSIATVTLIPTAASAAAKPSAPTTKEYVGYDISWPQCGKKLPTGQAFGIVGVNGGKASDTNPCLAEQLVWANKSLGGSAQPPVQLYVNTANPGQVISQVTTWPTSNNDKSGNPAPNPYATTSPCTGANDLACSWQYGWNRAYEANIERFTPAANSAKINTNAGAYTWWLDVETINTWQTGSVDALARNAATLEGMTAYYTSKGAKVGLYSTAVQWNSIVSTVGSTSNLNGLPNWRPSGASLANAIENCSVAPLTAGGSITLTQYVQQNLDKNHSCN